jgi:hypothetical protein
MEILTFNGTSVEQNREHSSAGHICPNANGTYVLTGAGKYSINFRIGPENRKSLPCVPSTHPEFYLSVPLEAGRQYNMGKDPFKGKPASLHMADRDEPVGTVSIGALGKGESGSWSRSDFTIDKRVHLIVGAEQIVSVPFSNDRIIINPASVPEILRENKVDYLFVDSTPPKVLRAGEAFEYELDIKTSYKHVNLELSAAPEGMKMTPNGKVSWTIPDDVSPSEVDVIITIESEGGAHPAFHTFRFSIESK